MRAALKKLLSKLFCGQVWNTAGGAIFFIGEAHADMPYQLNS